VIFIPTYRYRCNNCLNEFEELHSISDKLIKCPKCGKNSLQIILGHPAIHYNSPGFYAVDSKKEDKK